MTKTAVKPDNTDTGPVEIFTLHCQKGDDILKMPTDTWSEKRRLEEAIDELLGRGKKLVVNRRGSSFLIQGYNPQSHSWVTGHGAKNAGYEPFRKGDAVGELIPNSGG